MDLDIDNNVVFKFDYRHMSAHVQSVHCSHCRSRSGTYKAAMYDADLDSSERPQRQISIYSEPLVLLHVTYMPCSEANSNISLVTQLYCCAGTSDLT